MRRQAGAAAKAGAKAAQAAREMHVRVAAGRHTDRRRGVRV